MELSTDQDGIAGRLPRGTQHGFVVLSPIDTALVRFREGELVRKRPRRQALEELHFGCGHLGAPPPSAGPGEEQGRQGFM